MDDENTTTADSGYVSDSWREKLNSSPAYQKIVRLVKMQKLWTTDRFDELIFSKIKAAEADLYTVGITSGELFDEAVITYCVMNLGSINPNEYDRLKKAYDEMRAQMQVACNANDYRLKLQEADYGDTR